MDLPIKLIIVIVMAVLVLTVVSLFLLGYIGPNQRRADAERVFNSLCIEYGRQGCIWDVTERADFNQFVASCKILYGEEREGLSCLYAICTNCKNFAPSQVRCEAQCSVIRGYKIRANDITESCSYYATECPGISCDVCQ